MATVSITINGVICDLNGRTITGPVKIVGEAMYSDLGVGGGPIQPPSGSPPGIWGPTDPRPTPPIALPPGYPGSPPGIWPGPGPLPPLPGGGEHPAHPIVIPPTIWPDPPEGQAPHPEHPIVIPPPPDIPSAPPIQAKIVWVPPGYPNSGWNVVYVPTGEHPAPG